MKHKTNPTEHAVFEMETQREAECAIKLLVKAEFSSDDICFIGMSYANGGYPLDPSEGGGRLNSRGKIEISWSSISGLLLRSATFFAPGIGLVVIAGCISSSLAGVSYVGGDGVLTSALQAIGVETSEIRKYEGALKAGHCLLLLQGISENIEHAKDVLKGKFSSQLEPLVARQGASLI